MKLIKESDEARKRELFQRMLRSSVEFCPELPSEEDIKSSAKRIFVYPEDVGFLETRVNEIGQFTLPANDLYINDSSSGSSGVKLTLPKIPVKFLHQTVSLFDKFIAKSGMGNSTLEAFVQIFWDREKEEYFIHVPEQVVSVVSVNYLNTQEIMSKHLLVMDIHSHNNMSAFFSGTDDRDEKSTRLFGVVGRMDDEWPSASFRMGVAGRYHYLDPTLIFDIEGDDSKLLFEDSEHGRNVLVNVSRNEDIPDAWIDNIKLHDDVIKAQLREAEAKKRRNAIKVTDTRRFTPIMSRREEQRNLFDDFFGHGGGSQVEISLVDEPQVIKLLEDTADVMYEDPYSIAEALIDNINDNDSIFALLESIKDSHPDILVDFLSDISSGTKGDSEETE